MADAPKAFDAFPFTPRTRRLLKPMANKEERAAFHMGLTLGLVRPDIGQKVLAELIAFVLADDPESTPADHQVWFESALEQILAEEPDVEFQYGGDFGRPEGAPTSRDESLRRLWKTVSRRTMPDA